MAFCTKSGSRTFALLQQGTGCGILAVQPEWWTESVICVSCRSYLLDAIDSSVDLVNDGIVLLQEQAPHAKTFKKLTSIKV